MVDEFVGAQPPPNVERFLEGLLSTEADALVASGDEEALRQALELEPGRADAAVPLARILHERGEDEEALEVLGNVGGSFAADGLAARIRLEDDPALREAFEDLDAGETERGLDALIAAIATNGDDRREDLRRAVVGVLDDLGVEHPLAREFRQARKRPVLGAGWTALRARARVGRRPRPARGADRARRPRSRPAGPSSLTALGGA